MPLEGAIVPVVPDSSPAMIDLRDRDTHLTDLFYEINDRKDKIRVAKKRMREFGLDDPDLHRWKSEVEQLQRKHKSYRDMPPEEFRKARESEQADIEKKLKTPAQTMGNVLDSEIPVMDIWYQSRKDVEAIQIRSQGKEWDEFCGQPDAKREGMRIVDQINNPDRYPALARMPGNLLLIGPTGSGKGLLAKIIASCANCNFYRVDSKRFSKSAAFYDALLNIANDGPGISIILIDEVDSVFSKGAKVRTENVQRLWESDESFPNVLMMACTNDLDALPHAIRSRYSNKVQFNALDATAQIEIMRYMFKKQQAKNPIQMSEEEWSSLHPLLDNCGIKDARELKSIVNKIATRPADERSEQMKSASSSDPMPALRSVVFADFQAVLSSPASLVDVNEAMDKAVKWMQETFVLDFRMVNAQPTEKDLVIAVEDLLGGHLMPDDILLALGAKKENIKNLRITKGYIHHLRDLYDNLGKCIAKAFEGMVELKNDTGKKLRLTRSEKRDNTGQLIYYSESNANTSNEMRRGLFIRALRHRLVLPDPARTAYAKSIAFRDEEWFWKTDQFHDVERALALLPGPGLGWKEGTFLTLWINGAYPKLLTVGEVQPSRFLFNVQPSVVDFIQERCFVSGPTLKTAMDFCGLPDVSSPLWNQVYERLYLHDGYFPECDIEEIPERVHLRVYDHAPCTFVTPNGGESNVLWIPTMILRDIYKCYLNQFLCRGRVRREKNVPRECMEVVNDMLLELLCLHDDEESQFAKAMKSYECVKDLLEEWD